MLRWLQVVRWRPGASLAQQRAPVVLAVPQGPGRLPAQLPSWTRVYRNIPQALRPRKEQWEQFE
jgi:hypothetical protein